jgi:hypothetical protein
LPTSITDQSGITTPRRKVTQGQECCAVVAMILRLGLRSPDINPVVATDSSNA